MFFQHDAPGRRFCVGDRHDWRQLVTVGAAVSSSHVECAWSYVSTMKADIVENETLPRSSL